MARRGWDYLRQRRTALRWPNCMSLNDSFRAHRLLKSVKIDLQRPISPTPSKRRIGLIRLASTCSISIVVLISPFLGLLGWDDTKIVFTKRTLLEFLRYVAPFSLSKSDTWHKRYTGTSVDTNMSTIAKLPSPSCLSSRGSGPHPPQSTLLSER